MANNYLKDAGPLQWNDLSVDQNQIVALCAPRPVLISSGASTSPSGDGLAFHQHAGGHTELPSWPTFLRFAERYSKQP